MKLMNIRITLATLDQAPSIAAILQEAFREYEALYTPEAFAVTTPTAQQIPDRWDEGPVWVALQNDVIAMPRYPSRDLCIFAAWRSRPPHGEMGLENHCFGKLNDLRAKTICNGCS